MEFCDQHKKAMNSIYGKPLYPEVWDEEEVRRAHEQHDRMQSLQLESNNQESCREEEESDPPRQKRRRRRVRPFF